MAVAAALAAALSGAASAAPQIAGAGFPASADAGAGIPIWVDVNSTSPVDQALLFYSNPGTGQMEYVLMNLTSGNGTSGRWSYTIPAQPWDGTVECRVTVTDMAGSTVQYPASGTAVVRIVGEEEPSPFPWNLVFVVAFLAVALVLTELVFKPGLYRKTGREKARELEEEDRLREAGEGGAGREG